MSKLNYRYKIKIPKNIEFFFCDKRKIAIIKVLSKITCVKTDVVLKLISSNTVLITNSRFNNDAVNSSKKKIRKLKKILRFTLLKNLYEVTTNFCTIIIINGIGYKILKINLFESELFQLKLGFSHKIFLKPSKFVFVATSKAKIYVSGDSFSNVTQFSSFVRSLKKPDPYKGKGLLYENEIITLKQGKKT